MKCEFCGVSRWARDIQSQEHVEARAEEKATQHTVLMQGGFYFRRQFFFIKMRLMCGPWTDVHISKLNKSYRLWFSKNVVPPTLLFREDRNKWQTFPLSFADSWSVKTRGKKIPPLTIFLWDCSGPSDFPWKGSDLIKQEEIDAHSARCRFYRPISSTWIGHRN